MFGLLSKKLVQRHSALHAEGPKSYTRFHPKQPQTRFPTVPARAPAPETIVSTAPVKTPRPVLVKPGRIDENAHLYADAKVSVSILRKALPRRFEKMGNAFGSAAAS